MPITTGPRTDGLDEEEARQIAQKIILAQAWFPADIDGAVQGAREFNFALAFEGTPLTEHCPITSSVRHGGPAPVVMPANRCLSHLSIPG